MATFDEIRHRIEEADTARSARRSAAATQIGELAQRRANIVEQLEDIERQLGEVLAAARDVIDIAELSRFTDVPAADLIRWLDARTSHKTSRIKRKRPAADAPARKKTTSADASRVRRPAPSQAATAGASTRAAAQTT
ncbi:hypothetical protein [Amycolatopsis pigmentata]|uniref:Uncharacterized protein n=1 Tax=Amycolatopsis pigmentata TaxID=450801 RepID=A0ABW5FNG3_9PSEU